MRRAWDDRERGEQEAAYRAHLREMSAARQAAERRRTLARRDDAEARRAADRAFREEIARIAEAHRAWLHAHLPVEALPGERHEPRSRCAAPRG